MVQLGRQVCAHGSTWSGLPIGVITELGDRSLFGKMEEVVTAVIGAEEWERGRYQ